MQFLVGAVVIGLLALSTFWVKRHLERNSRIDAVSDRRFADAYRLTSVPNWQVFVMVFFSAPAAVGACDVLVSYHFFSDTYLADVGIACAWSALISNVVTLAFLYKTSRRPNSQPQIDLDDELTPQWHAAFGEDMLPAA